MKIFFVIKSLFLPAGTERATINVANGLAERNHQVVIISLVNDGDPFFEINSKVEVQYLFPAKDKRLSLIRDIDRRVKLRKIFLERQPDVIVIVGSGRSMLNIPAARGFKNITWEHFNMKVNWHLMHPLSKRIAAKYSDRLVTLTLQDADNYNKKLGANAVCIPNAVTIDSSVKSPLSEKRVLAIGRLTHQKGFDLLLEAWNKVHNKKQGWKLRIVGSGKMLPELTKKIEKYALADSVEIVPSASNVIQHYHEASIYVMSSRFEGLPLVLIEAMSLGLPIVSFDCETGPREIVDDGVTGKLVPFLDTTKLASELDGLMENEQLRKSYSKTAISKSKMFELDFILDKWEALFNEIINQPSPTR